MAKLNAPVSDACFDPESEPDKGNGKGKHIFYADSNAIISTAKIQREDPEDLEEVEHLFHSEM